MRLDALPSGGAYYEQRGNVHALVAKVVLVVDELQVVQLVKAPPAIWPVLYRTALYTTLMFVAQMLEFSAEGWISGGSLAAGMQSAGEHLVLEHIAFVYLWVFVLLASYTTVSELRERHGATPLRRLSFSHDRA